MQAAPAHEDCHELPSERAPIHDDVVDESTESNPVNVRVFVPPEIQIQIIYHYSEAPTRTGCAFCRLFELSTACRVNKLWYHYAMKMLYSVVGLDMSKLCDQHFHLSSKILQMKKRIPLLVRTLESQPRLADMVRRIEFPVSTCASGIPGALSFWVTCALEKKWLPSLIRACGKLEAVEGLEDILNQLFKEHWICYIDDGCQQRHGYLAQSLIEKTTLKEWTWGHGHLENIHDRVAGGAYHTFSDCHRNWKGLEHLSVIGLSGMTSHLIASACQKLQSLKQLTIGFGVTYPTDTSREEFTTTLLSSLPKSLEKINFVDKVTKVSMGLIMDWVDDRVSEKISKELPHYKSDGGYTDSYVAQRPASPSISGEIQVAFQVDEENYRCFSAWHVQRNYSRYSQVKVHATAKIMKIKISF